MPGCTDCRRTRTRRPSRPTAERSTGSTCAWQVPAVYLPRKMRPSWSETVPACEYGPVQVTPRAGEGMDEPASARPSDEALENLGSRGWWQVRHGLFEVHPHVDGQRCSAHLRRQRLPGRVTGPGLAAGPAVPRRTLSGVVPLSHRVGFRERHSCPGVISGRSLRGTDRVTG